MKCEFEKDPFGPESPTNPDLRPSVTFREPSSYDPMVRVATENRRLAEEVEWKVARILSSKPPPQPRH